MIEPILNSHHAKILRMNQDFVHWLSPLDEGALTDLLSLAHYKKQIHEADGVLIGYAHDVNYVGLPLNSTPILLPRRVLRLQFR
jgi:predicted GNAT superfamily acetyltransferase